MIKYSIVVISYNQHRLTKQVIKSLMLLDYDKTEYEIILVDDGSAPPFSDFESQSLLDIKYCYIPRSETSGRAKARNHGARKALGEFIIFIDGDCIVNTDFIKNYEEYFAVNGLNLVLGTSGYLVETGLPAELTKGYMAEIDKLDPHNQLDFRFRLKKINNCSVLSHMHAGWLLFISRNFCIKRSLFEDMVGFDERFLGWGSEDVEFAYRLAKRNEIFDLISNKVFHVTGNNEPKINAAKYVSWVRNIGLLYSIHQDPCILLLMTQDKLIYEHFCLGGGWDIEYQISTFQALKERMKTLTTQKAGSLLNLAIVSTVADCGDSIDQFIRYHTQIGFNKIYLFVDDNDSETCAVAKQYSHVKVFLRDESLAALWKKTEAYNNPAKFNLIDAEVMVRQEMNFFVAHSLSQQEGVDWLVHIDVDELFFPNGAELQDHFKSLQLNGFRGMTYLNYESISTEMESPSIYQSSEYFKINFFRNKYWFFNQAQKKLLQDSPWLKCKYFNFYQNGKSSVSTYGNDVRFYDVHSIVGGGKRKMGGIDDPVILHFPCARYSDFIKKYNRLGNFSDVWMGYRRAGEYVENVHLESRDMLNQAGSATDRVREFYVDNFILDKEKISILVQFGLARRITFHSEVLGK